MSAILITYDLNSPGQRYGEVIDTIKKISGNYCHVGGSTWVVGGYGLTASGVSVKVREPMDNSDSLLCVDITGDSKQGWLSQDIWDWLNQYV